MAKHLLNKHKMLLCLNKHRELIDNKDMVIGGVKITKRWRRSCSSGSSHQWWSQNQRRHSGTHLQASKRWSPRSFRWADQASPPTPVVSSRRSWIQWIESSSLLSVLRTSTYSHHWQPFQMQSSPAPEFKTTISIFVQHWIFSPPHFFL